MSIYGKKATQPSMLRTTEILLNIEDYVDMFRCVPKHKGLYLILKDQLSDIAQVLRIRNLFFGALPRVGAKAWSQAAEANYKDSQIHSELSKLDKDQFLELLIPATNFNGKALKDPQGNDQFVVVRWDLDGITTTTLNGESNPVPLVVQMDGRQSLTKAAYKKKPRTASGVSTRGGKRRSASHMEFQFEEGDIDKPSNETPEERQRKIDDIATEKRMLDYMIANPIPGCPIETSKFEQISSLLDSRIKEFETKGTWGGVSKDGSVEEEIEEEG
jgi:hypothetical protein